MKFTRTLALALAAAAAFSMTACDDDSSTSPDAPAELNKTPFKMGSQEQKVLPSLLSIRKNGTIFISDLDAVPANVANIDVILYEDFNAASGKLDKNNAHLWSPKAFAADAVWGSSSLVTKYFNATAKAIDTKFAFLDETKFDISKISTKADFDEAIKTIATTDWETDVDVVTGDLIVIDASGTKAIAKITAANAVANAGTLSSTDNFAVNMEVLVAVKN